MRSSDVFYGLLAVMAAFGAVVAFASGVSPAVGVLMLAAGVVAAFAMITSAESAPQALIVGRRGGHRLNLLESELDSAGFAVAACPGPSSRPCPVLMGKPCPVPAHPSVTIAYLRDGGEAVPPCEHHFHVPTVTIDEGATVDRTGAARHVSWADGTRTAVAAVRELTHV